MNPHNNQDPMDIPAREIRSEELTDLSPMPFGQYKDSPMQDVPVGYLHWFYTCNADASFMPQVRRYIEKNLNALKMENKDLIWKRL